MGTAGVVGLSAIFLLFTATGSSGADKLVVSGARPAAVSQLAAVGRVPATQRLHLALGLPLRNEAELNRLLADLYDPASPAFHHWQTPQQLAERFGATEQDCQAVRDWAAAHGLEVTLTQLNRLVIDVEGNASAMENAFNVRLNLYNHPTENRTFFAPDTDPSLELAVAIQTISGLDNFSLMRPMHRVRPLDSQPLEPRSGTGPSGSYIGNDFRAAYVPGTALNGAGQSIGLVQFDGYYASDITTYESLAGLPNVPLTNVPVDGGVSAPGGGNSEVCLDIEMVISMAPGLSRVYVYEAPNPSPWPDILGRMQTDNLSRQLSCSWGGGGPNATAENIFKLMSAQGQSFFNATGDSDAFTSSISFPSDSTNITEVGGTTLTTGSGASYSSEKVWNWGLVQGSYVGSSGGISTYYKIPNYQAPVSMASNQGSTTMRNVPDVALTADNIYVRYNNGSAGIFGGTSCAAPLWAAFTALINQQAAANGSSAVGFLNPPLYSLALGANYNTVFHDITVGDNTSSSSPSKFFAVTGYDLCTGWGTPKLALINALAGTPTPQLASNSLTLTVEGCANGAVDPGETVTMNFGLKNIGAANTTNLTVTLQASGGVTSPSAPQAYGVLLAGGAAVTRSYSFAAAGACGGSITATLQLQDGAANLGTIAFVIPLGVSTPVTPLGQNFDAVSPPALPAGWTSAAVSGAQTDWVTSTSTYDSSPNTAFIADSPNLGVNALVSPVFLVGSATAQLTFRQNYNLEYRKRGANTTYYDGGVLEVSINGGSFTDILSSGGSFVTGGYDVTLASSNPYPGRQGWGGNSAAYITTTVNMPAAAAGQNVQLRWLCSVNGDNSNGGVGWYVDSISLSDIVNVCCTGNGTAPTITSQPTNQTVVAGSTATFNVGATGSPSPAYQWFFNSTNALAGKTSASLSLANVQPTNAGGYSVIVSNSAGSRTSSVAQLTVLVPPSITGQPTNKTVVVGSNTTFAVSATGTLPLSYQWRLASTNLPAATASVLSLTNIQTAQAGGYSAVVSNSAGSVTSTVAQLTVLVPPSIISQPSNQTVITGGNALFTVSATGTLPLNYQWRFVGTNLAGATSSMLGLTNVQLANTGPYTAVVSNSAGAATSTVATLKVLTFPIVSGITRTGSVVYVSFASDAGLSYTLEYKNGLDDTNWTPLPPPTPGTGALLLLQDVDSPGFNRFYRVRAE